MAAPSRRLLLGSALGLSLGAWAGRAPAATGPDPRLPPPDLSHAVQNYSRQLGWPDGVTPRAPEGFTVNAFATGLDSPRWMHRLPNGDILVAEARTVPKPPENAEDREKLEKQRAAGTIAGESANRVTLLRDADGDGVAETRQVLLTGLKQPFGMLWQNGWLYIANTDALMRYRYTPGGDRIDPATAQRLLDLPAGGYNNHWTRNVVAAPDGRKLYVTVGSASNNGEFGMEREARRAAILEIDPEGGSQRIFAHGLRNPNGLDWEPQTGALWTAVNERDNIGDDLVPDYITSVREGGFYGWPYAYWGRNPDPRMAQERPDLVAQSLKPDYAVGSHTASIGLAFLRQGDGFPARYRGGAFVAQRGSWNRVPFSGYQLAFIPFADGRPSGPLEPFLTGFMPDSGTGETYGRPVGVIEDGRGALLVTDDTGNRIWRVAPAR
ncbi:PQQ-dependent sugar dehydrogenase [Teichococcus aestuarii]|uniref:L-sorbosone dehydrogenase n=1 Tax=Teichococcus aestuarii TaxID=568898 RepID=A0A2U1V7C8_9PROT|nr:sorbosone dehydrogenase family protein [Pseudoroseomonas aestuarii]PWC29802.1 L-sorbosone dehydrogenase [Pseudoroseomonas aestuarii]